MLVLRFENKKGLGYFYSGDDNKITNILGIKKFDLHPHDPLRMPTPWNENMIFDKSYFFGFENWEQMSNSFRPKIRKLINKHGSTRLNVYKINKNKVVKAKSQLAFVKEKSHLVYSGRTNLSKKELEKRLEKINPKYKL